MPRTVPGTRGLRLREDLIAARRAGFCSAGLELPPLLSNLLCLSFPGAAPQPARGFSYPKQAAPLTSSTPTPPPDVEEQHTAFSLWFFIFYF